jgi:hypothetical protein
VGGVSAKDFFRAPPSAIRRLKYLQAAQRGAVDKAEPLLVRLNSDLESKLFFSRWLCHVVGSAAPLSTLLKNARRVLIEHARWFRPAVIHEASRKRDVHAASILRCDAYIISNRKIRRKRSLTKQQ